ncbi:MAG: DUF4156 domain-containing protein [Betaproteobacteria bacterium]|nr:DUF4156 domain-containing protein [Betaproteobacteria bacterium]MDH4324423.1 DUF4156 domain-containing protein [Betaproteobacteria bacterium]MDH5210223.1 DUF4156 domain-containing protein [Betaproteobacteria bacterium]MDH5578413.1 DUF4156 domain-containing protein [Betaproteobacteria bacterium]
MRAVPPVLVAIALAGGCSLVELTPAGAGVRLASAEAVVTCTSLGRITASVIHEVGFLPRHPDAVQDNINVTARNSAANMGADTIVPASKIEDGKQTFEVYRCLRR